MVLPPPRADTKPADNGTTGDGRRQGRRLVHRANQMFKVRNFSSLAGEPLVDCPANEALELRNAATISVLGSAARHLSRDDSRRVDTQPVR